jgi:peptide/nickel transport system substrate-binding protein
VLILRPPRPTFRMALPVLAALWLLGVAAHSEAQTADQPKRGGTVNMSAYADAEVWEPVGSGSLSSVQAYSQLFPQLVEYDMTVKDTSQIVCDLCTDWKVSNGGRTFTFHLVKNAQWGDGTPITADDVVFSLSRYMDPKVPIGRSGLFRNYTLPVAEGGVKKIDDYTVEMNLSFAAGAFLQFLALDYVKILPKHVLEKEGDLKQAEKIIKHRAWGGPFKLVEYQRGNFYRVARNEKYYKKGKPYLDGITHFIVVDTGRLMSSFQAGQLDMMNSGFSNLTPKEYLDLQAQMGGKLVVNELPGSRNWGFMMNVKKKPFSDPRVRKAIYLAIDRQELNQLVENGTAAPACVFMPGFVHTEDECLSWPGIRPKDTPGGQQDLALAKQLMREAGYPNGFTTTFEARQVGTYPDTCTVIKQQLEKTLGITGPIRTHESAAGYALYATSRQGEGDWEVACQGEGMTVLDPDAVMGGVYLKGATRNYTNWEPPIVRELFEKQKVEQDPQKRRAILKELVQFLVPTDPQ